MTPVKLKSGKTMWVTPWSIGRCKHGRFYSYRWVNYESDTVEDSEPEYGNASCRKCREEGNY